MIVKAQPMNSREIPQPHPRLSMPVANLLLTRAAARPDKIAVSFPADQLTYLELRDRAWDMARLLGGLGLGPGRNVGILMLNSPEYVVTLFAISMVGATAVPINARYKASELSYLVEDAQVCAIITHDRHIDYVDFGNLIEEALRAPSCRAPDERSKIVSRPTMIMLGEEREGFLSLEALRTQRAPLPNEELIRRCNSLPTRSTAAIVYTSGTTSRPRGAMLSHEAIVGGWSMAAERWELDADTCFWAPVPLFHIAAIGPLISVLSRGGTFISDSYFDAARAIHQIERERATVLYPCYPPITEAIIDHPDFAGADFSSVISWVNVAPPETLERMDRAIPGAAQITCYGSTESGPIVFGSPSAPREIRLRKSGRPLPGVELRVIDPETGDDAAIGEPGEIINRAYCNFDGYWNDPSSTDLTISAEGWIHTGDLGELDDDGYLTYLGRSKEMLKVGGENVAPAEVEEALSTHDAVKLVQVVGIPDSRLVEVAAAFVELKEGRSVSSDELLDHCRSRLAAFKVPRLIRFVTDWPMSATKIQRSALRESLLVELESAGTRAS